MPVRRLAWAAALTSMCVAAAPGAGQQETAPRSVGSVVLVHGAWGGGWDWRPVDRMLTDRGWDVYRVTLTGLGERVHLVGPDVTLSTHIQDVVNTILFEDLHDVVLVGHSYGGLVITGVADSIPERLAQLIYVDAAVPESGELPFGGMAPEGDVIAPSWVNPEDPYPRDVPHPAATLREPLVLKGPVGAGVPGAYILTLEPGEDQDSFSESAARAEALGWPVHVLEADHNPQRSKRDELIALLQEITGH
jgi:pimeloyl-ACP methyl ester carboxylesterase